MRSPDPVAARLRRLSRGRRDARPVPAAGRAGARHGRAHVSGFRPGPGRPAGRREGHPGRSRTSTWPWPGCGTRTSSRSSPSTRSRSGASAGSACRSWAGRAWRASWKTLPMSPSSSAPASCSSRSSTATRGTTPAAPRADGPFRRSLEQASYVEAMTWIASCLADALHYSHARGLVHMDIKPSNVLITMDGQPMLLDFHLARGPILAGERGAGPSGRDAGLDVARAGAGDGRHRGGPPGSRWPSTGDPTSSRSASCSARPSARSHSARTAVSRGPRCARPRA